jgi:hypothetical protein
VSALRGLLGGVIGLSLLEATISTAEASNNASAAITLVTGAMRRLIDPAVPLIPDRRAAVAARYSN